MGDSLDFVAGCFGGAAGVLVGHPFDTAKVRLALQSSKNQIYKGTFDCLKSTIQKESVAGLYKGVTSPLYSLAAINAIVFGVQGNVLRRMENPNSLKSHFIAGASAGFLQCGICGPMELAKIRLQSQGEGMRKGTRGVYSGTVDCLRKIYQVEGIKGIGQGMNATIMREVPAFGCYFLTYEWLCRKLIKEGEYECSTPSLLLAGGLAGCSAWIISYPVDVIKTRIQKDGTLHKRKFTYKYSGYSDCIRQSVAADGYRVFGQGLNATLIRAFPTNAATFTVVAWCLRITRPNENREERKATLERASMIAQLEG